MTQPTAVLAVILSKLQDLMLRMTEPNSDKEAIAREIDKTLEPCSGEEIIGLANIIAGKQTHLPGYPDSVVILERRK